MNCNSLDRVLIPQIGQNRADFERLARPFLHDRNRHDFCRLCGKRRLLPAVIPEHLEEHFAPHPRNPPENRGFADLLELSNSKEGRVCRPPNPAVRPRYRLLGRFIALGGGLSASPHCLQHIGDIPAGPDHRGDGQNQAADRAAGRRPGLHHALHHRKIGVISGIPNKPQN